MQIINVIQGSPEWAQHRATHFNASDVPAMLGVSPYKTRNQLLHEMATGIVPDVDVATQRRFDDGHRFEALARPLAEKIIGQELYPVVGSEGKLSASFDGITMDNTTIFEHKSMNAELRNMDEPESLPVHYRAQMEQQLMLSGANACLFMASAWDSDDKLIEEKHCWYQPDMVLRDQILQAWTQFAIDLKNYVPSEIVEKPVAEAIMQLPAVVINATGALSVCNLDKITPRFDAFLSEAKTSLVTDDDFANGEATAKFSRNTAKTLKLKAKEVVGQIATVSEAVRTLELYAEKFDKLGLLLEKAVKEQKEAIKAKIVGDARHAFLNHVNALYEETKPIEIPVTQPDFAGSMKGMRTIASLHNAVNTELANAKIAADAAAKDIRGKLAWLKVAYVGYELLFHDLQNLVAKPMDDFQLAVTSRIEGQKKAEADKLETERKRIQAEEEAKARVKAEKMGAPATASGVAVAAVAPTGMTMTIDPAGAPPPWQEARDRVVVMLDELTLAELDLVERYIRRREWAAKVAA